MSHLTSSLGHAGLVIILLESINVSETFMYEAMVSCGKVIVFTSIYELSKARLLTSQFSAENLQ